MLVPLYSSYCDCINNYIKIEWLKTITNLILSLNLTFAQAWGGTKVRTWKHLKSHSSPCLMLEDSCLLKLLELLARSIPSLLKCPGRPQNTVYGFCPESEWGRERVGGRGEEGRRSGERERQTDKQTERQRDRKSAIFWFRMSLWPFLA